MKMVPSLRFLLAAVLVIAALAAVGTAAAKDPPVYKNCTNLNKEVPARNRPAKAPPTFGAKVPSLGSWPISPWRLS